MFETSKSEIDWACVCNLYTFLISNYCSTQHSTQHSTYTNRKQSLKSTFILIEDKQDFVSISKGNKMKLLSFLSSFFTLKQKAMQINYTRNCNLFPLIFIHLQLSQTNYKLNIIHKIQLCFLTVFLSCCCWIEF